MSFDGTPVPTGNAEAAIGVATVRPFSADDDETVQAVEGSATALEAALDSSDLDVCFLVDTSGGMERYLDGVIRVIQNIARELHGHQGIRYPRFALVAYNDFPFDATVHSHLPDVFDFTTNLDVFGSNVEKGLTAKVASDYAEDVHSGLHAVLGLNFGDNSTKLLLHIADAPCHGAHFHHPGMLDDYAQADPEATLALVRDIARRKIDFVFCAIEDEPGVPVAKRKNRTKFSTQTMFDRFDKAYSAAHPQRRSMTLTDLSDPANIVAEVRQAIVTSLSSTSVLSAFQQQHCAVRQRRFVRTVRPANFAAYPLIKCDQHSIKLRADKLQRLVTHPAEVFAGLTAADFERNTMARLYLRMQPLPFARGSFRFAHRMQAEFLKQGTGAITTKQMVMKRSAYELDSAEEKEACETDLREQALAGALAKEFSRQLKERVVPELMRRRDEPLSALARKGLAVATGKALVFDLANVEPSRVQRAQVGHGMKYRDLSQLASGVYAESGEVPEDMQLDSLKGHWVVEKKIGANFVKYSDNNGTVKRADKPDGQIAHAFSHWSHWFTAGRFLVADLQGAETDKGVFLTDPVIHDAKPRAPGEQRLFGGGDRGRTGIDRFFATHKCNAVCGLLGLPK